MGDRGVRLDTTLVDRGLARSRTQAARLIAAGLVSVDGHGAVRASTPVRDDQRVEIAGDDHYVSRAAHKLVAALDGFRVEVTGLEGLDVGASTGGFTQVLLERGARAVTALDVGHGQLEPSIRNDARVTVIEGANARYLTAETLSDLAGRVLAPAIVVADLSFISLTQVLPALVASVGDSPEWVLLIKPQFEVGRTGVREGIVHDAGLRSEAVMTVLWAAWDLGLPTAGILSSPIVGTAGNHEYLVHFSVSSGTNPTEWIGEVEALTGVSRRADQPVPPAAPSNPPQGDHT